MSRIASPAEKIMAVAATYKALVTELVRDDMVRPDMSAESILDAAVRIAMGTDTRDLGILSSADKPLFMDPPVGTDPKWDPLHPVAADDRQAMAMPDGYDENDPYARE